MIDFWILGQLEGNCETPDQLLVGGAMPQSIPRLARTALSHILFSLFQRTSKWGWLDITILV